MNNRYCILILFLIFHILLFSASGCSSSHTRYNNEYLHSAQELERALEQNPDSKNKETIKKRIDKLYKLHQHMIELEHYNKKTGNRE
jgi:hypothetical protein